MNRVHSYRVAVLLLVGVLLLITWTVQAQQPAKEKEDTLASINEQFREFYKFARIEKLARNGPVILSEGDKLVLLLRSKRYEAETTPPDYTVLKTIAHIPLRLYLSGRMRSDLKQPEEPKQKTNTPVITLPAVAEPTRTYGELLVVAREEIEKRHFRAEVKSDLLKLIRDSIPFWEDYRKRDEVALADVQAFAKRLAPLVSAVSAEAARIQLDHLHAQVSVWRKWMTDDEWRRLRVIIMGSHMPRPDNLTTQYFAKLLGEKGEGMRIIYAEALWDEQKALDLLGTVLLDTDIGRDFFGDEKYMHRDLLADPAKEYLSKMKLD